jgi:hypothetical protein
VNLAQTVLGVEFQNPVLLASGTCGYGSELDGFFDIDRLGGLVIKAVTADVRSGNPAPRVAEFAGGMINSVGLANPGPDVVVREKLPWLAARLRRARVLVNVAGRSAAEYGEIIARLEDAPGFAGYELNVSCPNVKEGGAIISTREDLLADAVRCRPQRHPPADARQAGAQRARHRPHGRDRRGPRRRWTDARQYHAGPALRHRHAAAGARRRQRRRQRAGAAAHRRACRVARAASA